MYPCKSKLRFLFFLAESLFIAFTFYFLVLRGSSKVKWQKSSRGDTWEQRESDIWSDPSGAPKEIISMQNCPEDWPLEVVRRASVDGTRQPAQVCRKKHGIGEWKCAPGWRAQVEDPYCVYTGIMKPPAGFYEGLDAYVSHQVFGQVSDKRKLMFVHLPHTGGKLIEKSVLFDDSGKKLRKNHFDDDHKISDLDQDRYKTYHKFSVVRHPCSRLISAWKYLTQGSADSGDKIWATRHLDKASMTSFNDFVTTTLFPGGLVDIGSQVHLRTQVSMLFDDKEQFRLDKLLVYEKWSESVTELGNSFYIDTSQLLSSYDSSREEKLCKEMYTPSTWLKMTQIYTMDFCVLGYSRQIDEVDSFPPLNRTRKSLSNRFQNCMKSVKDKLKSQKQSQKQSQATNVMKKKEPCTMYTYFQKQSNVADQDAQEHYDTIDVWKTTWSQAGWTPRVLSEEDAKKHPEYDILRQKFFDLPTINPKEYEMACFMRHVAMAAVGGGWMSDYDVVPLRIPTCVEPLNGGRYTVYENYTPCLVSGSGDEFTRVSKMMAYVDWRNNEKLSDHGRPHVSDMHMFNLFVKNASVEPMRVVIEARALFTQPFLCNRTWASANNALTPIPSEFTPLPWVIHFAHDSFGFWRKQNVSSLWPGSSWNGVSLTRKSAVRPIVMKEAFDFLRTTCNYFKT